MGRSRGSIEVSGRPHAAKIITPRLGSFKDQYNLTWTVNSFLPIEEYRILYRVNSVCQFFHTIYQKIRTSKHFSVLIYMFHCSKWWLSSVRFKYSSVPNRRIGPNKRAGGKILKKTLNVQYEINLKVRHLVKNTQMCRILVDVQ